MSQILDLSQVEAGVRISDLGRDDVERIAANSR
jgi:hypothetical protein